MHSLLFWAESKPKDERKINKYTTVKSFELQRKTNLPTLHCIQKTDFSMT